MERHFERFAAGFLVAFMLLLLVNPNVFASTPALQQMDNWAPQWVWALVYGAVGMGHALVLFVRPRRATRKWAVLVTGATCLFIAVVFCLGNPNGPGWVSVGWIGVCCFWAAWLLR